MFYRENGQFKNSYQADQQIFPIRQDRIFMLGLLLVAVVLVPLLASNYFLQAILTPFLILSLAAIGLNILGSEEHTSELQSLMRISYAVFCLKKKMKDDNVKRTHHTRNDHKQQYEH